MSTIHGPLDMILRPKKYFARWGGIYSQWEFWVMCVAVIGTYELLQANHLMLAYFRIHPGDAKALTAAIIMLPMPYFMSRKEKRLNGRQDWFQRFLAGFARPGRVLPSIIVAFLTITIIAFLCPIFTDPSTKQPLSGLIMVLHHPLVGGIPFIYAVCAALVMWDFREWRWLALIWILGCYVGTYAVGGIYSDPNGSVADSFVWAFLAVLVLPLLCMSLCLIPQRTRK